MNVFTAKWGMKLVKSLATRTKLLKEAKQIKQNGTFDEYKAFIDKEVPKWLDPLLSAAQVDFTVKGKEKIPQNEAVIYTPNHAGMFDIPAVVINTPTMPVFMAKKELKKVPVIKDWMEVLDCVFVDRSNKEKAHQSICDAIDKVKNGRSLVIFPEGTRSKTGELGEFKGGAMKIAMETGAKVVPVLIEGTRGRFEETGNITPGTVHVTFLDPIETKGLTKEDFYKMPSEIRAMLENERKSASGGNA